LPTQIVFRNASVFDGSSADLRPNAIVGVKNGIIDRVSERPWEVGEETEVIDCGRRVLMPGLIDAHVHV
jgi:imidazolonepropionase-like amidohydrolase